MKFYKPLKLKKGQIDLRSIGAQEQHEEAIARMRAKEARTALQDEAGDLILLEGAPRPSTPLPSPYVRPTVNYLEVILSTPKKLIAIMRP